MGTASGGLPKTLAAVFLDDREMPGTADYFLPDPALGQKLFVAAVAAYGMCPTAATIPYPCYELDKLRDPKDSYRYLFWSRIYSLEATSVGPSLDRTLPLAHLTFDMGMPETFVWPGTAAAPDKGEGTARSLSGLGQFVLDVFGRAGLALMAVVCLGVCCVVRCAPCNFRTRRPLRDDGTGESGLEFGASPRAGEAFRPEFYDKIMDSHDGH